MLETMEQEKGMFKTFTFFFFFFFDRAAHRKTAEEMGKPGWGWLRPLISCFSSLVHRKEAFDCMLQTVNGSRDTAVVRLHVFTARQGVTEDIRAPLPPW